MLRILKGGLFLMAKDSQSSKHCQMNASAFCWNVCQLDLDNLTTLTVPLHVSSIPVHFDEWVRQVAQVIKLFPTKVYAI
jgi:hypothetical protein